MKKLPFENNWPESWKYSYPYDEIEIWGQHGKDYGYWYAYENRRRSTLKLISEVLPKGAKILDVAAAQGNFSLSLAEMGYRVTWNDLRVDLVDYVRLKYEFGDIEFQPGNVFELGIENEFDAVLVTEIIEHVAHPDDFLRKISAMVKPGGYVVMTTPNGAYCINNLPRFSDCKNPEVFESVQFKPNSDGHIFLLWPDEVVSLAEKAGLIVEKVSHFTTPLSGGHLKLRWVLPWLPKAIVQGMDRCISVLPARLNQRLFAQTAARYRRPS